jgi:hypothetical protein
MTNRAGYLYIGVMASGARIKIGFTEHLKIRERQLELTPDSYYSGGFRIIAFCESTLYEELTAHRLLFNSRISRYERKSSEWYRRTPEVLAYIRALRPRLKLWNRTPRVLVHCRKCKAHRFRFSYGNPKYCLTCELYRRYGKWELLERLSNPLHDECRMPPCLTRKLQESGLA